MSEDIVRHSQAEIADLITDPIARAEREAANSLRQAQRMDDIIIAAHHNDRPFKLRPSLLLDLNRQAIDGINSYAGNYRPAGVQIGKSKHQPPGAFSVPELVEDMCDYVNENWSGKSAVHLSAYVLWKINWIHPFADGNGRTARAVSYIVLCASSRLHLPGVNTIPEQIIEHRNEYYNCLETADEIWEMKNLQNPVEKLELLLSDMLATQLLSSYSTATGEKIDTDQ